MAGLIKIQLSGSCQFIKAKLLFCAFGMLTEQPKFFGIKTGSR